MAKYVAVFDLPDGVEPNVPPCWYYAPNKVIAFGSYRPMPEKLPYTLGLPEPEYVSGFNACLDKIGGEYD